MSLSVLIFDFLSVFDSEMNDGYSSLYDVIILLWDSLYLATDLFKFLD